MKKIFFCVPYYTYTYKQSMDIYWSYKKCYEIEDKPLSKQYGVYAAINSNNPTNLLSKYVMFGCLNRWKEIKTGSL